MKKYYSKILVFFSLLAITFLICMLSPLDIFTFNEATGIDSSVFKYIGWMMAEGQVPYLDTFDHKGLLIYFVNYLGYLISPHRGLWFIELLFMFVAVLFSYKIARKFVSKPWALLITLITLAPLYNYFGGGNYTEEYAFPLQIVALYIFLDFFLSPDKYMSTGKNYKTKLNFKFFNWLVFFNGLCFGGVLFLRPNMIAVWLVFGLMVFIYTIAKKKYLELFKFILSFVLGTLTIAIPMFIYLIVNGAFQSFVDDYILFNFAYTSDEGNMASVVQVWEKFFNVPLMILAFTVIVVKIYLQVKNKENFYFNLGYLIFMFLSFAFVCMSGRDYDHYAITLVPITIYPLCLLFNHLIKLKPSNGELRLVVTVILIVVFAAPNWLGFLSSALTTITDDEKEPYTMEVIKYVEAYTDEDDLISVFGNNNIIYNYTHRMSASKYSYQYPIIFIDKDMEKEYFEDLKENKPKMIVSCYTFEKYPEFKEKWLNFLDDNGYKLTFNSECAVYEK